MDRRQILMQQAEQNAQNANTPLNQYNRAMADFMDSGGMDDPQKAQAYEKQMKEKFGISDNDMNMRFTADTTSSGQGFQYSAQFNSGNFDQQAYNDQVNNQTAQSSAGDEQAYQDSMQQAQATATNAASTNSNSEGGSWPGMFNFQEIMNQFYNYKPGEDDEMGNAIKQTFASNMIQSAFDKEMAKEMGMFQNALGQSNMQAAAALELKNNAALMDKEFNLGQLSMGNQMELQNEFANAQYNRDVAMQAAQGEEARKIQDNQSYNNRLETMLQGEEQRTTDDNRITREAEETRTNLAVQGGEQRLTDTNRIQVTGSETRKNTITAGQEQRKTDTNRITTTGQEQRLTDTNRITTTGQEQRLTDSNRIRTEGDELRQTRRVEGDEQRQTDTNRIRTTGDEQRTTMDKQQRLEARTRAENRGASRSTARSF